MVGFDVLTDIGSDVEAFFDAAMQEGLILESAPQRRPLEPVTNPVYTFDRIITPGTFHILKDEATLRALVERAKIFHRPETHFGPEHIILYQVTSLDQLATDDDVQWAGDCDTIYLPTHRVHGTKYTNVFEYFKFEGYDPDGGFPDFNRNCFNVNEVEDVGYGVDIRFNVKLDRGVFIPVFLRYVIRLLDPLLENGLTVEKKHTKYRIKSGDVELFSVFPQDNWTSLGERTSSYNLVTDKPYVVQNTYPIQNVHPDSVGLVREFARKLEEIKLDQSKGIIFPSFNWK